MFICFTRKPSVCTTLNRNVMFANSIRRNQKQEIQSCKDGKNLSNGWINSMIVHVIFFFFLSRFLQQENTNVNTILTNKIMMIIFLLTTIKIIQDCIHYQMHSIPQCSLPSWILRVTSFHNFPDRLATFPSSLYNYL